MILNGRWKADYTVQRFGEHNTCPCQFVGWPPDLDRRPGATGCHRVGMAGKVGDNYFLFDARFTMEPEENAVHRGAQFRRH